MPHTMLNEDRRILYIIFLFPIQDAQVDLQELSLVVETMASISLNIYIFSPFQQWVSTCNYMEKNDYKNI